MRLDGKVHDWALEFDRNFVDAMKDRDMKLLTHIDQRLLDIAHPTLDHYIPSLTVAGASTPNDHLYFITEGMDLGSLSMRSFVLHQKT